MGDFLRRHREGITYLVSGFVSMFASWGAYALVKLGVDVNVRAWMGFAVFVRFLAGAGTAYVMNRILVFRSHDPHVLKEMARFFASRISTLLMDMAIMQLLPGVFGMSDWAATFVSQVVVTVGNYVMGKFLVFVKEGE